MSHGLRATEIAIDVSLADYEDDVAKLRHCAVMLRDLYCALELRAEEIEKQKATETAERSATWKEQF